MKFGVAIPNYGENLTVQGMVSVAREAELLGFDSIWATDHIMMPSSSGTPYERIFESLTAMSYLAGCTSRVQLGISALIIAMRNPVTAAKQLATLDSLSAGRLVLALGTGWNEKEFESLDYDFGNRGKRVDESIRIMRKLFGGASSFRGRWTGIEFSDSVFEPLPAHKIPILIGGTSPAAMRRAAALGDGWHPNVSSLGDFGQLVAEFRKLEGAQGKEIHIRMGMNVRSTLGEYVGAQGDKRVWFSADRGGNERIVQTLHELDVDGIVVSTSPKGTTPLAEQIEGLEMIHDRFMSQ